MSIKKNIPFATGKGLRYLRVHPRGPRSEADLNDFYGFVLGLLQVVKTVIEKSGGGRGSGATRTGVAADFPGREPANSSGR